MPLNGEFWVVYLWQVYFPHQTGGVFGGLLRSFKLNFFSLCFPWWQIIFGAQDTKTEVKAGLSVFHIEPLRNERLASLKGINKRKVFLPNFFLFTSFSFCLPLSFESLGHLIKVLQNKQRKFLFHSMVQH